MKNREISPQSFIPWEREGHSRPNSVRFHAFAHLRICLIAYFYPSQQNLTVLTWFVVGLVFAWDCRLTRIARHIPWQTTVPSRTQRFLRGLKNPKMEPMLLAKQVATQWLANQAWGTLYLVSDRTDIDNRHSWLFIGLCHRGRTLPLVWHVMPYKGATNFNTQVTLLREVLPLIPQN